MLTPTIWSRMRPGSSSRHPPLLSSLALAVSLGSCGPAGQMDGGIRIEDTGALGPPADADELRAAVETITVAFCESWLQCSAEAPFSGASAVEDCVYSVLSRRRL